MELDDLQQAWQAQSSRTRVTVDANLLLQEVHRNQQDFLATILRRDLLEIGTALLLLPVWVYLGNILSLPWTWYLGVPAIAWIAVFLLYYRLRYPLTASQPNESLVACVKRSLAQVEQQIWLLRNVFWWYLLPPGLSILAFFGHVTWLRSVNGLDVLGRADVFIVFVAVYFFLYFLNQHAVRTDLEPRRLELLNLLASLGEETKFRERRTSPGGQNPKCAGNRFGSWLVATGLCVAALVMIPLTGQLLQSSGDQTPISSGPAGDKLADLVSKLRKEKNLVGLAAMVTVDGKLTAAAVEGERKKGTGVELDIADRWHLGGIAKSINATMIARLVKAGQVNWTDTVGEVFSDPSVHDDWRAVTILELLTDTAGAPRNFPREVRALRPPFGPKCTEARREAVLGVLREKPIHPPGEQYAYSNVGHTIAAAMVEKLTGVSWVDLVQREVFQPLKLADTGFGPPTSPNDTLPQPRGHHTIQGWKIAVDDQTDNNTIMAPSGRVHMSLANLCTYANEHLLGHLGKGTLVDVDTYQVLHTPARAGYSCGWIKKEPSGLIPHTVYWHNGSNTLWYALVVFIPETNMVVAVTSNDGDMDGAEAAAWMIVAACANDFGLEADTLLSAARRTGEYPKMAPFAAVRWQESEPEVQVNGTWYKLLAIDNLSTPQIVAFSKQTYEDKWKKRFEEDLVELLSRMGHPPGDTVALKVEELNSGVSQVLPDVRMTEANRRAIRKAAADREAAGE